ncbi:ParA family protein [Bifidobacterium tibiigranuli]|jgi:chromosome partitioning protein|uniref:ParA family protein n=1 Tax=Bifidobacterium tibiigranuli TaxID=2172043 RepID=UPI002352B1DC|nr:ParA family protein [Bifidobacterium tibiigranuli]MCI1211109.1 ParA family protein [Bifidobacterium tibiigranuli]MCI1220381.1 ParA family protein [Bifidobacterium tibiigranuli]MCI1231937.1 ParA family protein [Bifidobacterium tibiigranuli]MCI1255027.1 ParA family protein [Bifidobacterium tibiigranuli]
MIVTIANAKGGVAKTTSALFLAMAWTCRRPDSKAVILDADPQSSASLWRDIAEDNGETLGSVDVRPANLSTLQRAVKHPTDGLTVVDAPPQGRLLEAAITPADFVIVPTSDSPLDLQQAWATMNSIPEGKPAAVLIVRAETNTRAYQATIDALDRNRTPRFDTVVRKRQDIKAAMGHKPAKLWEYAQVLAELTEEEQA